MKLKQDVSLKNVSSIMLPWGKGDFGDSHFLTVPGHSWGEVGCFPVHMTSQKNRKCTSLPLYEDASDSKYSLTFSTYQPGFWEMMKFAWMQYISILLIFLWIFERIKIFLLRNQVLNIVPVSLLPPLLSYKEHKS